MTDSNFSKFKVGKKFSKFFEIKEQLVNDFAKLTGDKNPIHLDNKYASNTIFGQRIAHGALIYSLISEVLGMHFPGPGTILLEQKIKFLNPVYIDDKIEIIVIIKSVLKLKKRFLIDINCIKSDSTVVISGESLIKYLEY